MANLSLVRGRLNVLRLTVLLLLFLSPHVTAAQQQSAPTISVTVNKSMVFRLAARAKRVSMSQPAIADVIVVAPSQLLITGKAVGATSLIIFDEKGDVTNYDLLVTPDVAGLRAQLRAAFPNDRVEVSTSGPSLVLRGEVANEVVYEKVLEMVETYLPPKAPGAVAPQTTNVAINTVANTVPTSGTGFAGGGQIAFVDQPDLISVDRFGGKGKIDGIVDLLVIKEVRQIELDVIVAEVSWTKLQEIGFDFSVKTPTVTSNTFLGTLASFAGGPSGSFSFINGATSLVALYRMLQNKDVAEILAQPRLVMKNGRSGGFLSGGEFPVVNNTVNNFGNGTVEFKPFGVRLDFVPTITWSDRIDLRVFPEVSDIDPAVNVNGVPGLVVRRTLNRVEMKEGESLIIGGLLDRRILKDLTKFPILGDIPILGALFRSTKFRNKESELVFVITPRIVRTMKPGEKPQLPSIEKYDDPDIRQVPLPGSPEPKRPATPGATIP